MKKISMAEFRRQFPAGIKFTTLDITHNHNKEDIETRIIDKQFTPDSYPREMKTINAYKYTATRAYDTDTVEVISEMTLKYCTAYESERCEGVYFIEVDENEPGDMFVSPIGTITYFKEINKEVK